jgi:8-oxo-dGTP diphosphatase
VSRSLLVPGEPLTPEQAQRGVAGIDWEHWQPTVRATLGFVIQGERILLIRKKRGIGAGKITGPGGKLDPGETPLACVVRELQEELGITTQGTRESGEFCAQFVDGLAMHVSVFVADRYCGEVRESDEAEPRWFDVRQVPYDEMWPDNRLWMPELMTGRRFDARFVLDHDRLFDAELLG